jgi:hypothetical protein
MSKKVSSTIPRKIVIVYKEGNAYNVVQWLAIRPVYDENVLLCDSRSKVVDVDELYKKLFDKPTIG